MTLTLLGEERLLVEWSHHGGTQVQRSEVAEVTVTAIHVPLVQLGLDADWMLLTGHTPLEVLCSSPFVLTLEES